MKIEIKINNFRDIANKVLPYFKKHTEQTVVVGVLIIVGIAALLSSILFYRFSINPKKLTDDEIGYKEMKIQVQDEVLQYIEVDKKKENNLENINNPFE